jgi:aspartyl-tRNA(Asn)/glutamyl-tRNA(Gln) amidotransferase subunit A
MDSSVFSFTPLPEKPFHADTLRVAVQPNMSCRGWPQSAGSPALENYTALEDAFVIQQLRQAGAVIAGTTRMSELGFGLVNDTGSRAVTDGLADAALIIDHLGEARAAAARAGIFGFKPSWGSVSRRGLAGLVPSMECWGMAARHVSDIQEVMTAICTVDDQDFSMHPGPLPDFSLPRRSFQNQAPVIGVAGGYESCLGPDETFAWETALSALETAGCRIIPVSLPDPALFSLALHIIAAVEASSSAGRYDGVRYGHRTGTCADWNEMYLKTRGESFGTLIKTFLFQGAYFQFQQYETFEQACRARGLLMDQTLAAMAELDGLASLTLRALPDPAAARTVADTFEAFGFTLPASLTGLPALQVPGLACQGKRDLGLHITGKPFKDPDLLALARFLENLTHTAGAA